MAITSRLALAAAAGAVSASLTWAQDPRLDIQFSYGADEPGPWVDDILTLPGGPVFVRVVMHIPETYYGVAAARFNLSSDIGNWQAGTDQVDLRTAKGSPTDARMPGFDLGNIPQQVFENNRLRIDAAGDSADDPNSGITIGQIGPLAAGSSFNTGKSVTIYKFKITPFSFTTSGQIRLSIADDAGHGSPDQLVSFRVYQSGTSSSSIELPGAYGDSGVITIPAPSVLLAIPLAAARRRRSWLRSWR